MNVNEIKNENNLIILSITLTDSEFNNYFIRCESCGEIVLKESAVYTEGGYYCPDCVSCCDACGALAGIRPLVRLRTGNVESA